MTELTPELRTEVYEVITSMPTEKQTLLYSVLSQAMLAGNRISFSWYPGDDVAVSSSGQGNTTTITLTTPMPKSALVNLAAASA
jgi:hypothetical protein